MTQVYMVEVMYNHHVIKRLKELERYWKQQKKKNVCLSSMTQHGYSSTETLYPAVLCICFLT